MEIYDGKRRPYDEQKQKGNPEYKTYKSIICESELHVKFIF